jgi:glucose/arabinose dehydrogenase
VIGYTKEFKMRQITILLLVLLLAGLASTATAQSDLGDPFTVAVEVVADGLTSPVALVAPPDGSGRLFIVDQIGLVRVLSAGGELLDQPFLDVRDRLVELRSTFDERGLLGLAFHPAYAANGRFFVYYSAPLREGGPAGWDHTSHISEFSVSADANVADVNSEQILLQVDQPQFNHDGGTLIFGPGDGYLYISLGDGGGGNDVGLGHTPLIGNGQDITNLLGSILRLDVDGALPYAIPADNPFAGTPGCADGCDEIFAYGFRNPYRISFDMGGGRRLFAGDAGQLLWEEVSVVTIGGNYGWNIKEGSHCFDPDNPGQSPAECPDSGYLGERLIEPIIEYANQRQPGGLGTTVVGGHVYRGRDLPQFHGRYIFGDWSRSFGAADGSLFVATERKKGLWRMQELLIAGNPDGRLGHYLLGFGQAPDGEVYVLTSDTVGPSGDNGKVYKLARPGGG